MEWQWDPTLYEGSAQFYSRGRMPYPQTLADVLRRVDLDVLCVDLDPQGNLSDYFDVPADASPTVADVLRGDAKVKAAQKAKRAAAKKG